MAIQVKAAMRSAAIVAVAFAAWLITPLVRIEILQGEGSVPPMTLTDARLPHEVTIQGEDILCGSGGCWRELIVAASGRGRSQIMTELGLTRPLPDETCEPVSLIDRRHVCIGATEYAQPADDNQLVI